MALVKNTYKEIRSKMKPGDILAFGGKGEFSNIIKWATRAPVSHVGIVLQTHDTVDDETDYLNLIIESTSLNGFSGVIMRRLSQAIEFYEGEVWWLPLSEETRSKLDVKAFFDFLRKQEGKPYDMPQAVKSALDAMDKIPLLGTTTYNREDISKFFCSELAAKGLEEGGAIKNVNASEVTPIDLCMFNIYGPDYHQLKGEPNQIKGYNSTDPTGWGE
jgi:hypothetical protein